MTAKLLRFLDLSDRHYGVTEELAGALAQAASVCLDRHHGSPVDFTLDDNKNLYGAEAQWPHVDRRTKAAWANTTDATEDGACALAICEMEEVRGLVTIARAETRTGADYYLGPPKPEPADLEQSLRLEVSGIDEGDDGMISARLNRKLKQAAKGESNLPAAAAVVGFAALKIVSADVT